MSGGIRSSSLGHRRELHMSHRILDTGLRERRSKILDERRDLGRPLGMFEVEGPGVFVFTAGAQPSHLT